MLSAGLQTKRPQLMMRTSRRSTRYELFLADIPNGGRLICLRWVEQEEAQEE